MKMMCRATQEAGTTLKDDQSTYSLDGIPYHSEHKGLYKGAWACEVATNVASKAQWLSKKSLCPYNRYRDLEELIQIMARAKCSR
jgi:hypothetical protein